MEKEYYNIQEIIFGLKDEYQQVFDKLASLKSYCSKNGKKVKDFEFIIWKYQDTYQVRCWYERPDFKEFINNIKAFFISRDLSEDDAILARDHSDKYYFISFVGKHYPISIGNYADKDFSRELSKILDTDFVKNTTYGGYSLENSTLTLSSRSASLSAKLDEDFYVYFRYEPSTKTLNVTSYKRPFTEGMIKKALSEQVPRQELNPYHLQVIDESGVLGKEITLENFTPCRLAKFDIEEKEDQIVLKKRKK